MKAPPPAVRLAPEITTCATFVAVGSFTAPAPVRVASPMMGLTPVQPWQLTQAPSKIVLPRGSKLAATPPLWEGGAGATFAEGSAAGARAGPGRGEPPLDALSPGVAYRSLLSPAPPTGPAAEPCLSAWPTAR